MTQKQSSKKRTSAKVLVLTDAIKGHTTQTLAVAESLKVPFQEIYLDYRWGINLLGWIPIPLKYCLKKECYQNLLKHFPGLIIATGSRLGKVSLSLKRMMQLKGQMTKSVQILDPVMNRQKYDLLCIPQHDMDTFSQAKQGRISKRMVNFLVSPHKVTKNALKEAKNEWRNTFSAYKKVKLGVFIGGKYKNRALSNKNASDLGGVLASCADKFSLQVLFSSSRRTGKALEECITHPLGSGHFLYKWSENAGKANPYMGIMAWADLFVVTGDSISMISEILATGKPVFIYMPKDFAIGKHRRFCNNLIDQGLALEIKDLQSATSVDEIVDKYYQNRSSMTDKILFSAPAIAQEIKQKFPDILS